MMMMILMMMMIILIIKIRRRRRMMMMFHINSRTCYSLIRQDVQGKLPLSAGDHA